MPDPSHGSADDPAGALREPPGPTDPLETAELRLARLRLRSRRRGIREMDLLLGAFAETELAGLPPEALAAYEALLSENDQDLYLWVSGARPAPARHGAIVRRIAAFHGLG